MVMVAIITSESGLCMAMLGVIIGDSGGLCLAMLEVLAGGPGGCVWSWLGYCISVKG